MQPASPPSPTAQRTFPLDIDFRSKVGTAWGAFLLVFGLLFFLVGTLTTPVGPVWWIFVLAMVALVALSDAMMSVAWISNRPGTLSVREGRLSVEWKREPYWVGRSRDGEFRTLLTRIPLGVYDLQGPFPLEQLRLTLAPMLRRGAVDRHRASVRLDVQQDHPWHAFVTGSVLPVRHADEIATMLRAAGGTVDDPRAVLPPE